MPLFFALCLCRCDAGIQGIPDGSADLEPDSIDGDGAADEDRSDDLDEDAGAPVTVAIEVDTGQAVAEVSPRFLSFAVDTSQVVGGHWWSPEAQATGALGEELVEPYDFTRPRLVRLARELAPAYLRIGGSEADTVFYQLGDDPPDKPPEPYQFWFTREQWDAVNQFALDLGFEVLFTLNAGPGPRDENGRWLDDQAREWIEYTLRAGYPVVLWELGNEINGFPIIHGLDFHLSPQQYAQDMAVLRALVDEIHPAGLVAGPSSAFWPIVGETNPILPGFLEVGGDLVEVITWHYYPQQSSRCLLAVRRAGPEVMLDPDNLDEFGRWAGWVESLRDRYAPGVPIWLGETGNAQCGGEPGVSDAFAGGFWWLDQLGQAARRGQPVVVRQTLSGSNYGLIDDQTIVPNPDYWNSLAWKRWMGTRVLETRVEPGCRWVRAYAHCTPSSGGESDGSVTLLVLNLDRERWVTVRGAGLGERVQVWRFTAADLTDRELYVNGVLLQTDAEGAPPEWVPVDLVGQEEPVVELPPTSYAFLVHPLADARACR